MYIEPNSIIRVMSDCPLNITQDHTLWFDSKQQQTDYFASITKYTFDKQSYQRVQQGSMRVGRKAEDLYNCNYLAFQNTSFGDKWFYAFINSVEYVNNVTSEIRFTIDVMQTWFFDYHLGNCFVEREHSKTDVIGENTVPENLEQGPYMENGVVELSYGLDTPWIVFITSFNDDDELTNATGKILNKVYTGLNVIAYQNATDANAFLNKVITANKIEGIVSVFMCPFPPILSEDVETRVATTSKYYASLDGYTPKNNKLYTSPYNILHVHTDTNSADFAYEYFRSPECQFQMVRSVIPTPAVSMIPVGYLSDGNPMIEQRLTITNMPQCAVNADVYKVYLAQNAASLPVSMIGGAIQSGIGVISGFLGGGLAGAAQAVSGITQVATQLAQVHDISTKPPQVNGTQTSLSDFAIGNKKFYAHKLSVRAEYAKIIDDYFSMYGYATHRVKHPNTHSRPEWNYVKTVGCVIHGPVPTDDIAQIASIYNKGFTFWKNPAHVGDYSYDNSPEVS